MGVHRTPSLIHSVAVSYTNPHNFLCLEILRCLCPSQCPPNHTHWREWVLDSCRPMSVPLLLCFGGCRDGRHRHRGQETNSRLTRFPSQMLGFSARQLPTTLPCQPGRPPMGSSNRHRHHHRGRDRCHHRECLHPRQSLDILSASRSRCPHRRHAV